MTFEVGAIVEGTVTGITKFGAFVQLTNGKTGLCHISEVADHYVKEIKDVLTTSQQVKVKIVSMEDGGKMALSIRQAEGGKERAPRVTEYRERSAYGYNRDKREGYPSQEARPRENFEDMLASFLKDSDEKQKTVKKTSNHGRKGNGYTTR